MQISNSRGLRLLQDALSAFDAEAAPLVLYLRGLAVLHEYAKVALDRRYVKIFQNSFTVIYHMLNDEEHEQFCQMAKNNPLLQPLWEWSIAHPSGPIND